MGSIRRIKRHASEIGKKSDFVQVMYLDFNSSAGDHLRRGRKIYKESMPKQKKMNNKRARRYFEALVEANFKGGRDLVLHLTFRQENYPASGAEARKKVKGFIRNVNAKRKRRGLDNARYVIVFETSKTGRYHVHIIMDGQLDRDIVEVTWKHGYCNADRLRADARDGLAAIIRYLSKGSNNDDMDEPDADGRDKWGKRWIPSQNLTRPWVSEGKSSITSKRFHQLAKLPEDSELLTSAIERDNKGYRLQSVEKSYNEQTGRWYIFCRMRKKNISTEKHNSG